MLKTIDVAAIENTIKIKSGIIKYTNIMDKLHNCDVSNDRDFQKAFNGFYRVRRAPKWQKVYYDYMEQNKNQFINFEDVLTYVYNNTGQIEASFSSKLLATVNPDMPVWDENVLSQLSIKRPSYSSKDRLKRNVETYSVLMKWYADYLKTPNAREVIARFDVLFSNARVTDLKKIDLALWSMGVKQ